MQTFYYMVQNAYGVHYISTPQTIAQVQAYAVGLVTPITFLTWYKGFNITPAQQQ